jgi:ComF family protein
MDNHVKDARPKKTRLLQRLSATARPLADVRDAALSVLYPTECRVCGRHIEAWGDGVACAQCWENAASGWSQLELCAKCGAPLSPLAPHLQLLQRECGKCREFAFSVARACGVYEGALLESVLRLKINPQLVPRLRQLVCTTFTDQPLLHQCESIIPVPLHPTRLAERGFNQAELIADALAAQTGLRVDTSSLLRVKPTERHRAGMDARERAKSLRRAFRVHAPRLIAGRVVLLVDDVMTTGTTAHEITQTLLEGGAQAVNVFTVARAASVFT